MASQTWETIPMEVKCLRHNVFKKNYKLFLLDSETLNIKLKKFNVYYILYICCIFLTVVFSSPKPNLTSSTLQPVL